MSSPTLTLRAQCLCRAQTFTTSLPASSLPIKASSCHCTSCRHLTGALRSSEAVWPGPKEDIIRAAASASATPNQEGGDGNTLRRYKFSPKVNVLFCGRCGSGLFFEQFPHADAAPEEVSYNVLTGALSVVEGWTRDDLGTVPVPVLQWENHDFVGDTVDGGAVCWLRGMNGSDGNGKPVRVWLGARGESEEVLPGVQWPVKWEMGPGYEANLKKAVGEEGEVGIRCHCGGVDLVLRAGEAQREFEGMQKRGEALPRIIDPVTHKAVGVIDPCDSCRVAAGSEMFNWTFCLLKHLSFAGSNSEGFPGDTTQLKAAVEAKKGSAGDSRIGTLAYYASSPDVQRYFCGRCSASIFYAVDSRPDMVDFSVGLLHAPEGARAESIISWSLGGQILWREDMIGTWREGLLHTVEKEVEEWRIERGYPKNWHRILREAARAKKQAEEQAQQQQQAGED